MDLLLILTYTALCVAIFKIFKIPLNKWTVPTAVLGGVVLIGTLILLMNYNHPHTALGGNVYVTTPIVPNVRGQVVDVPVQANQPLKQGDILFKIDQTRFKARVMEAKAALQDAQQSVLARQAAYSTAKANTLKALAERDRTKKEFERYQKGAKKGAFTASDVDNKRQIYLAAEASLEAAEAEEDRQLLSVTSQINGVDTTVAKAQAALEQAQFDLDSTIVRAPTDGYVTQVTLRPGMMAVPMPLRPVMTFVNEDRTRYVGAFRQNSLLRLKPGFEAEFIFRALPGKTFQGKVVEVLPAIAEGQIQAQGMLMGDKMFSDQGRALVVLEMTDDISEHMLPNGTNVEIAVYSDSFHHVSIMRKVLIRMKSWQNYLYLDH
ncbi:HlyD family secretion protein [Grimontia sp. S25]|uniref:HlyD family secretion protein n=1 Tax=Grimontia sedimenti TaxID=2711294 RepID=A0A6M1R5G0_9GAMM|nr:HlyD family secretion protein [Grimontia sedimenti]NGN97555.1 HlyD family secretion protein [Grimontia sedimenti]